MSDKDDANDGWVTVQVMMQTKFKDIDLRIIMVSTNCYEIQARFKPEGDWERVWLTQTYTDGVLALAKYILNIHQ